MKVKWGHQGGPDPTGPCPGEKGSQRCAEGPREDRGRGRRLHGPGGTGPGRRGHSVTSATSRSACPLVPRWPVSASHPGADAESSRHVPPPRDMAVEPPPFRTRFLRHARTRRRLMPARLRNRYAPSGFLTTDSCVCVLHPRGVPDVNKICRSLVGIGWAPGVFNRHFGRNSGCGTAILSTGEVLML